jgi:hypothetical protein
MQRGVVVSICVLAVSVLVLATAVVRAEEPRGVEPLWRAASDGHVKVTGGSAGGYDRAHLEITNTSECPVTVDVNGSYLRPSGSGERVQPLGIGLLQAGSGKTTIEVPTGKKVEVVCLSVCMDGGAHSPNPQTLMFLVKEPAPAPIARLLDQWRKKPNLNQGSVQSAVWGAAASLPPGGEATPVKPPEETTLLPEHTKRVAVIDGVVYCLLEHGELLCIRPGELPEVVGRNVSEIHPDGRAIYALCHAAPEARPTKTPERRFSVNRFDVGQRSWVETEELDGPSHLRWAREDAALVSCEGRLWLYSKGERKGLGDAADLVVGTDVGALLVGGGPNATSTQLTKLWTGFGAVKLDSDSIAEVVSDVVPVRNALYATTTGKGLIRVLGSDVTHLRIPQDLGSGDPFQGKLDLRCLSLHAVKTGVLIETEAGFLLHKPGSSPQVIVSPAQGAAIESDPRTGDLYARSERSLRRFDERTASWEDVRFLKP